MFLIHFFANIGNELANDINYSGTKDFTYYLRNRQNHKFTLNEVDEQTFTTIIENLPAKSSCGYDDISSIFLKQINNFYHYTFDDSTEQWDIPR